MTQDEQRQALRRAKRIVVKVGTKVLVEKTGRPDSGQVKQLVGDLAALQNSGSEVVFVSSGAIAAGLGSFDLRSRPRGMPDLQMVAAVGQVSLMRLYHDLFMANGVVVGQVLLTRDGLMQRKRHLNARNAMLKMISEGVVPIINENDAVATEEIKFGDNDVLAALVSVLVDADSLILLSSTDGLRDGGDRVPCIEEVDDDVLGLVSDKSDGLSSGGMSSKLQSAQIAAHNGIPVVIANGRKAGVLGRILQGKDEGTLLLPKAGTITKRKRWIAFFNQPAGSLIVDEGAAIALRRGNSLLLVGIVSESGEFEAGAMVDILSHEGERIARGLVEYSSDQIDALKGQQSSGEDGVAVHRDNMVNL